MGNANYQARPLKNTHADATAIAAALSDVGFTSHLKSETGHPATLTPYLDLSLSAMHKALSGFHQAARTAEMAVIYFSGHGIEINANNFLIPVEAELNDVVDVDWQTVPLAKVTSAVAVRFSSDWSYWTRVGTIHSPRQ